MRNGRGEPSAPIAGDFDCDVALIGAGITGALIAHARAEDGHEVVVLDRRDRALGSTAASTTLLQYELDTMLSELRRLVGPVRARRAYQACVDSIGLLDALDERWDVAPTSRVRARHAIVSAGYESLPLEPARLAHADLCGDLASRRPKHAAPPPPRAGRRLRIRVPVAAQEYFSRRQVASSTVLARIDTRGMDSRPWPDRSCVARIVQRGRQEHQRRHG